MNMIEFAQQNYILLFRALGEHLRMVLIAIVLSVFLAGILTVIGMFFRRTGNFLTHLFSIVYSIPSIALFALMIPVMGLGQSTAITVLVFYNQFILLRNFITGLNQVPEEVVEAATGMGMTRMQVIFQVQVPLAKKAIFVGVRLALVSTIAIAIIAAFIGAGGIGLLITIGLETGNYNRVLWGVLLSGGLTVIANGLLVFIEKRSNLDKRT